MARNQYTKPDTAYKHWIKRRKEFVPISVVAEHLIRMVEEQGGKGLGGSGDFTANGLYRVSRLVGMSERNLSRILEGKAESVTLDTVDRVAIACGVPLRDLVPPPGRDGWSEHGRYCGDGCPVMFEGCGTFHHEHEAGGLCGECVEREVRGVDLVPRDVRVCAGVLS